MISGKLQVAGKPSDGNGKWQMGEPSDGNGKWQMENGKLIMDNGELWNVFKIIASGDTSISHFQFSIFHYYPASLADKNEFEVWQTL